MDNKEKIKYWFELADYDIETARVNLSGGRLLYVGFMCHQTIEKALKAIITEISNDVPPKIHNLPILLEKASLDKKVSEDRLDFIRELNPLNVEARYPEYKQKIWQALSKEYCEKIIERTVDLLCWIKLQSSIMQTDTQTK